MYLGVFICKTRAIQDRTPPSRLNNPPKMLITLQKMVSVIIKYLEPQNIRLGFGWIHAVVQKSPNHN